MHGANNEVNIKQMKISSEQQLKSGQVERLMSCPTFVSGATTTSLFARSSVVLPLCQNILCSLCSLSLQEPPLFHVFPSMPIHPPLFPSLFRFCISSRPSCLRTPVFPETPPRRAFFNSFVSFRFLFLSLDF